MKIKTITIHNFRCFEDVTFRARDYALLVGANNVGKSNFIDALRIFYEKDLKYEDARDFPKFPTKDQESWMDFTFQLTDDEYADLKAEYRLPGNTLMVRRYMKTTERDNANKIRSGVFGYTETGIANEHFYGARNVQDGKLGEVIYIPDVSVLSDHTKMSGPSALRDLISDILKKLVKKSPSFQKLTSEFGSFSTTLKTEQTDDKHSLEGLEADVNAAIEEWGTEFELVINPLSENDLVKNLVSFRIREEALGDRLEATQFGQGFQRHLIYTFIRLAARYQEAPAKGRKKDFTPALTLLLFEEPEAFLHPQQVSNLSGDLMELSRQVDHQVICSTHSPAFVSPNSDDIAAIARLERIGGRTTIGQIPDTELATLFIDNQCLNDLFVKAGGHVMPEDTTEDMEAVKYFLWLNNERCAAFFARRVLLVEGPTERVFINHLIRTGHCIVPEGGVFALDCLGKYNIHRFMNLFRRLNIRHAVLYDGDGDKPIDRAVRDAIEHCKNDFTLGIHELPGTLERFLGITPARDQHRKPQHLMLEYLQGRIGPDRVKAFVDVVEGLLPDTASTPAPGGSIASEEAPDGGEAVPASDGDTTP